MEVDDGDVPHGDGSVKKQCPVEAKEVDPALLIIPEKPQREQRLRQAKSLPIFVNGYTLDLSHAVRTVYKYELKFVGIKKDGKEKDLTRGPKNDVAVALRRCALWKIYQTVLLENRVFFGSDVTKLYYDCGINFYSVDCLCTRDDGEKEFKHDLDIFPSEVRDFIPKMVSVVAKLLAVQEVDLFDVSAASADMGERERSVVQFLEVATTQMMLKQQDHWIFGNKDYVPPDSRNPDRRAQLGGGKILVPGMEKNVRFVGNGLDKITPMAQIDAKKSPFFDGRNLVDLVQELMENRSLRDLGRDARLKQKITRQLKELVVRTTHDVKNPKFFSIFSISPESAEELTFDLAGQRISVARYFQDKYGFRLRYPELPCVVERRYSVATKQVNNSFYPMETLQVCDGQRVDLKKQTPDLVEKMINGCRLLPRELLDENEKQRKLGSVDNRNPYLANIGIRVADSPSAAEATVLFPPTILYKDSKVEPRPTGELDWRLSVPRGARPHGFLLPANPPRRWVVFLFQDAVREDTCNRFVGALVQQAKKHNVMMTNPSRVERIDRTDSAAVDNEMQKMRKNGVEYVLFITRDKRDPVHDCMKLAEAKYNVVTQHVAAATAEKALGNRGPEMTLDNLVMKMNLKLGGINHGLGTSNEFMRQNRLNIKVVEQSWLRPSRMFVGLDMSHSAAQPLFERLAGQPPTEPTVVGMAYTMGDCGKMKGEYWMQQPRKVMIEDVEMHMTKALNAFKSEGKARSYPEHVIIYRGGVSEGEYAKVMAEEAPAIREAFKKIEQKEGKQLKMRLSVIIVQSNSNYRVFPSEISSGQQGNRSDQGYGGRDHSQGRGGYGDNRGGNDRYGNSGYGNNRGGNDRFGQGGQRGGFGGGAAAQNCPPGTCVDNEVVHPTHTEFLLIPHKSIMGTARPIRCTLLVDDEPRMSMDELEGVTNMLCYAHGIVTSPVSVPAQLYAASDLAKRGRNNWKTANYGDEEGSVASGEGGIFRNDGSEDFFRNISTQLAPKCRHKYWA